MVRTLAAALLAVALLAPTAASAARFALVVAENMPRGDHLAPLRFADDDGLRYRALFEALGAEVTLLTVLDEDTQRRNPTAARGLRPPTRAAVRAAVAAINERIAAARAAGEVTDFYFVFAGHGEIGPNGEGRMHLRDGTLTRHAFLDAVVARSQADFNHVLIDACHAAALVMRRGEDDGYRERDFSDVVDRYLAESDLSAYPNTGALLAASRGQETHEWEVFRAGVFSHQVRSGLAGVADTNTDGMIEYSELAAYVAAANATVRAPGARPELVMHPPALDRHRPLADITAHARRFLRLPPGFRGRAWLEDAAGDRYADFNASGEAPVVVALAGDAYYLRRGADEAAIAVRGAGTVDGGALQWKARSLGTRGAIDDAFRRQLYGVPFGPSFYQGFVAQAGWLPAIQQRERVVLPAEAELDDAPRRFGPWPWITAGAAVAAGGAALWLGLDAQRQLEDFEAQVDRRGLDDPAARDRITTRRDLSNVMLGTAAIAAGAAITLFWLDGPEAEAGIMVAPTPTGIGLGGVF